MGCCFSKRDSASVPPTPNPIQNHASDEKNQLEKEKKPAVSQAAEKKSVFLITSGGAATAVAAVEKENKKGEVLVVEEQQRPAAVRTSSCTKEEVDAILIQCGRLSRSSSGKASNETGGRKYSGSKRSYDFDAERRMGGEDEEWEKPVSRPSPHRRTPGRERSGSRERGSGGGRRVSRSPGRRSECPASSSSGCQNEKSKQPARMVSVPAREKSGVSEPGVIGVKRVSTGADAANRRCASPRSRSPASTFRASSESSHQHQSRKTELSPFRRNPMAEIDGNALQREQPFLRNKALKYREGDDVLRKPIQPQLQKSSESNFQMRKLEQRNIGDPVRDQLMSCKAKEQQPEPEGGKEAVEERGTSNLKTAVDIPTTMTRSRSSRRSSRDLDHNPISYASLLLEDIHNYQQQNTAFSLPACVSKACSILEAVADLNSSISDKSYDGDRSNNDNGSVNGRIARRVVPSKAPFVESEIVVKDDLMEPSLHKYVTVRDIGEEKEPQESAGSNSFIGGQVGAAASWEPNSVDSGDRSWTSRCTNSEEVVDVEQASHEKQQQQQQQQKTVSDVRERRSRGSGMPASSRRRGFDDRQAQYGGGGGGIGNGKIGGRGLAAASS